GLMMLAMLSAAMVGNLLLMPALLAGPLGAIFAWGIHRKQRRAEARQAVSGQPIRDFHAAEERVVPPPHKTLSPPIPASQPQPHTKPAAPAPHAGVGSPKPQESSSAPSHLPAPHSGASSPAKP